MNAYDAWAVASMSASFAVSVIAVCWASLRYNARNHVERMRKLAIQETKELSKDLDRMASRELGPAGNGQAIQETATGGPAG